jgi:methylated-DNA-[protein]-cysteine S-methyltransferase
MLVSNGAALTGVYMSDRKGGPEPQPGWQPGEAEFDAVASQLAAYFAGQLRDFDVPLAPEGTEFQKKVWRELCRIPFGETISYSELARRIGQPTASRAVGLANGRNPIAIIVPCHRVIGADGSLTGYGGGIDRKKWLLGHEAMTGLQAVSRNLFTRGRRTVEQITRATR